MCNYQNVKPSASNGNFNQTFKKNGRNMKAELMLQRDMLKGESESAVVISDQSLSWEFAVKRECRDLIAHNIELIKELDREILRHNYPHEFIPHESTEDYQIYITGKPWLQN